MEYMKLRRGGLFPDAFFKRMKDKLLARKIRWWCRSRSQVWR
jgi:hypothetical protein